MTQYDEIAGYVMPHVPAQPSDFALVFGTRHGVEAFADAIAEIWSSRLTSVIVISGGQTAGETRPEADVLCELAVARGVPRESMLLERRACNTGENVLMTRDLIAADQRLASAKSVLAVGKISAVRRYLMTMARHMAHLRASMYAVNHYNVAREQWYTHPEFRARVLAEYQKIPAYLDAGYLTEIWVGLPGETTGP
jgi:uncharacterized SAM-binding protein YcdF (DUF218 family)